MTSPLSINSVSNSFYSSEKAPEMSSGGSYKTERETDSFPIQAQKRRRIAPRSDSLEISPEAIDRTAQTSLNTVSLSLASRCADPHIIERSTNHSSRFFPRFAFLLAPQIGRQKYDTKDSPPFTRFRYLMPNHMNSDLRSREYFQRSPNLLTTADLKDPAEEDQSSLDQINSLSKSQNDQENTIDSLANTPPSAAIQQIEPFHAVKPHVTYIPFCGCSDLGPSPLQSTDSSLYRNNLKNQFLTESALPHIFHSHSSLASRQWSLAPNKKSGELPYQNPDSSGCSGIKDQMSLDLINKEKSAINFLLNTSKKIPLQQQNISSHTVENNHSIPIRYSQTTKPVTSTRTNQIPIEIFNHNQLPFLCKIRIPNTFTKLQSDGKKWIYQGSFKQGRFDGYGKLRIQHPNGELDFMYEGQFYGGLFEGMGELQYGQGTNYKGTFSGGRFNGKGTLWNDLSFYEGDFRNNLYHGQGTLTIEGDNYVGQFRDGRIHGRGTLRYKNGYTYTGLFEYSSFHGQGKITRSDGSTLYEGIFHNNEFHGPGTFNELTGRCYTGIFLRGFFHEGTLKIKKPDGTIEEITFRKTSS